jgi:CDP-diacylglycerol--serine O-phosphatidyltransferase
MNRRIRRPNVRRAAPALPNGFTLGNLFFGVFAIISASRGDFSRAVLCIVLGGVCDAFDGTVARATRSGSRFGEELDSLVDAISFGLAPGMIVYFSTLSRDGWAWLPVFFFSACAVLRLARFNVTQAGESKSYFIGLPSPAAGGTLATYYWFSQTPLYNQTQVGDLRWPQIMQWLTLILAILMISPVPYPAWPKIGLRTWRGRGALLLLIGMVIGSTLYSKYFFFLFGIAYVGYGLLRAVLLGLVERGNGTGDRRRADDHAPLPDFPPPVGADAIAVDPDDDDDDDIEYFDADPAPAPGAGQPAGVATAAAGFDDDEDGAGSVAPRRRRKRRRPRGDRPNPPRPSTRPEDLPE